MTFFSVVERWRIPESAIAESLREMAQDGAVGNEGVVLWLGRRVNGQAELTHLVGLRGSGVHKQPDRLIIESYLLNDVTDLCLELALVLIGQIHSHGPWAGTDLSITDRSYGIRVPYYLSLVAPDYAMRSETDIADCGVHVYEPHLDYRRMSPKEVSERIVLLPGMLVPLLVVGSD